MKRLATIALGIVLIVTLGLGAAIVAAQQDGSLVLVGNMNGDKIAGGLTFVAGSAAFALIVIAGIALFRAGGLVRSIAAGLLFVGAAVGAVFGILVFAWFSIWDSASTYVRLPDGNREVIVSITSFTSVGYSVYAGSGVLFHRVTGNLPDAPQDPPALSADDFELHDGVLRYASVPGGPLTNMLGP